MPTSWCWCSTPQQDISEQDAHIAGFILEAGRALVVAVNKWDAVDEARREQIKREFARKLEFLAFARLHYVSALDRARPRRTAHLGGRGLRCRHGQAAHAQAHARADRRDHAPGAAARRHVPAQAALRPPRRHEPAHHRHPRQPARPACRTATAATWSGSSPTRSACEGTPVRIQFDGEHQPLCQTQLTGSGKAQRNEVEYGNCGNSVKLLVVNRRRKSIRRQEAS